MIVTITELFFQRLQRSYGNRAFWRVTRAAKERARKAAASGPFFSAPRNNVLLSRHFSRLQQMETLTKKKRKKIKKERKEEGKERKEEKRTKK